MILGAEANRAQKDLSQEAGAARAKPSGRIVKTTHYKPFPSWEWATDAPKGADVVSRLLTMPEDYSGGMPSALIRLFLGGVAERGESSITSPL